MSPARRTPSRPPFLVALAIVLHASPLAAQARHYTVAGDSVAIFDLAGTVVVEAARTGAVDVEVTPAGADAARLRVEQGEVGARSTLRVLFPGDRIRYRRPGNWARASHGRTELRVRTDGTFDEGHAAHGSRGDHDSRRVIISSDDGLDAHADLRILVPAGRSVAVYVAVGRLTATNVNGRLRLDTSDADIDASGTRGSLIASVGSGDVRVTGHEGELTIDTGSGDVTVDGLRDAAELHVDTGSGQVRLTGAGAERAVLETGSGDVTVTLDRVLGEVSVETGSGDVTLHLPATLGADVDLETSSGDIETDFPVAIAHHADDRITGRIGSGGGRIRVETGSGAVRLLRRD